MKRTLTLQSQLFLSLLIGMALSFISVRAFPPTLTRETPTVLPSSTETPLALQTPAPSITPKPINTDPYKPYVTISGVWLVRAQVSSKDSPQILKVTRLKEGRITPFAQGDYQIQLLNAAGNALFSGSFAVSFVEGDPPRPVEQVTTLLIVPILENAVQILLKTPQGETTYDIQP